MAYLPQHVALYSLNKYAKENTGLSIFFGLDIGFGN